MPPLGGTGRPSPAASHGRPRPTLGRGMQSVREQRHPNAMSQSAGTGVRGRGRSRGRDRDRGGRNGVGLMLRGKSSRGAAAELAAERTLKRSGGQVDALRRLAATHRRQRSGGNAAPLRGTGALHGSAAPASPQEVTSARSKPRPHVLDLFGELAEVPEGDGSESGQ